MAESEETVSRTISSRYKDVELQSPSEDVGLGGGSNHRDGRTVQRKGWGSGTGGIFRFLGRKSNDVKVKELMDICLGFEESRLQRFSYDELHEATRGFSERIVLDTFDQHTYKGFLKGRHVAVKVFDRSSRFAENYITEIEAANLVSHRNVVGLLGWCYKGGHFSAVYEFFPNGTLSDYLAFSTTDPDPKCCRSLPWEVRYWKIAMGLASALLYMHEKLRISIIHRNVKSSIVLLDSDFNPMLSTFGLSLFLPSDELELEACVCGTPGYLDPSYYLTGRCSKLSDVYSFGVVALEIATGRSRLHKYLDEHVLKDWVEELYKKGVILEATDPRLGNVFNEQQMERLLLVGLWCTRKDPESRPSIRLILQLLNFEVPMPSNLPDVFGTNSSSSPASVEENPMMAEFLADLGDYENILAASSSIPTQEAASRIAPANIVSALESLPSMAQQMSAIQERTITIMF